MFPFYTLSAFSKLFCPLLWCHRQQPVVDLLTEKNLYAWDWRFYFKVHIWIYFQQATTRKRAFSLVKYSTAIQAPQTALTLFLPRHIFHNHIPIWIFSQVRCSVEFCYLSKGTTHQFQAEWDNSWYTVIILSITEYAVFLEHFVSFMFRNQNMLPWNTD